jgi:hypothetical protein
MVFLLFKNVNAVRAQGGRQLKKGGKRRQLKGKKD